ncbi:sensor histidine kinase [Peristeroidobacter agariperforans]|uniref:sensor histidine kinase n=1 Tax=Peristeroidobacter agariperforans TaxID=268404 RepID=UPI00101B7BA9|nr:histidine kinase [Peristeroidobacter agariperforans]
MAVVSPASPVTKIRLIGVISPTGMLLWLWAAFCLIMILVAVQDELHNPYIAWWEPLLWEGSSCVVATMWLLLQRHYKLRYAPYLDQPLQWFGRHLVWLPVLIVTFIGFAYGVRHAVYALLGGAYRHEPWLFVIGYESLKLVLFSGLWLGIIFGFDSFEQWQAQRRHLLELQKSLAEAQLSQLKAQLRPHFFFNALNTISALMHVDVERADRMLARLGDLLRISLQINDKEMTSLREEMRTLELFAQIMQERFADRVGLSWEVDPNLLEAQVPMLLLQPLLENAFKHGVERSVGPVSIRVAVRRQSDRIVLEIRNTGSALPTEQREGVGLRNCRERLKVIYGSEATLQLANDADSVVAVVTLPERPG